MVGRDRELARVMLLLDDALAGGGRLVLCTGEAGIGKTRLAEEAAASAAARGVPVAWARAADAGSLPPYGLWRLVLDEPAVRAADDDPTGAGLWSRVFGAAERPALADGADSGSAQRFALFAEVRRRLAQAARPSGLLLVLDDLQWADEASAVLLADVVRQLRGTLILVLATYRESAASGDTGAGLLPRLSADANTERVDLRGLPVGTVISYCPSCRDVWGFPCFLVCWCCYGKSMPAGTDIQGCWPGLVRRAAGLRCPELVMRVLQSASVAGAQGMQSLLPALRRAGSCPVSIQ
jgi:hypothetical protein